MPKYAPVNDEGLKPYAVTRWSFGRETTVIAYAGSVAVAKVKAFGSRLGSDYISECRRATPADIEQFRKVR